MTFILQIFSLIYRNGTPHLYQTQDQLNYHILYSRTSWTVQLSDIEH